MSYPIEIIRYQDQLTSNWSGGTTTQIAIYPKDAVYSDKNFKWRLSSATVEQEESLFTSLPGIERVIMVLAGEMKLEHTGYHTVYLKPFEQDSFSGDWTTKSFGKVRDFNLMLSAGCSGQLNAVTVQSQSSQTIDVSPSAPPVTTRAFYCVDGKLTFIVSTNESYELRAGDLLLLHTKSDCAGTVVTLDNAYADHTHLVIAAITY